MPRSLSLLPLVVLAVSLAAAPAHAGISVVGRWEVVDSTGEQDGKVEPGGGATLELTENGGFTDSRDAGAASWSIDGRQLELTYGGKTPRWTIGEVSPDGRDGLAFSCHTEAVEEEGDRTAWDDNRRVRLRRLAAPAQAVEIPPEPEAAPAETPFPQGAWVDGDGVNLRAAPATDAESLGKLKRGEGLEVTGTGPLEAIGTSGRHPWYYVKVLRSGKLGWVFGAFLKPIEGCSN